MPSKRFCTVNFFGKVFELYVIVPDVGGFVSDSQGVNSRRCAFPSRAWPLHPIGRACIAIKC
jgi:hypothetical protein